MKKDTTAYGAVRPKWDTRDCTVRAFAVATGCSYEQASAIFSAAGRQLKKGTSVELSAKVHEEMFKMVRTNWVMPLAAFLLLNPSGRFILHKKGHAFAVVDGVVHDWENTTKAKT